MPLIAVCMVILFVAVTISVDIARIQLTRAELRTATDAAARAGAEALGRTQDPEAARQAAIRLAAQNEVAGAALTIRSNQIEIGQATANGSGEFIFNPNGAVPNTVRVTGLRTSGSADGPVGMFFGPLFGVSEFQPLQVASATRMDRDVCLVLDVSGSMTGLPFAGLQEAVRVFLTQLAASREDIRLSLVVYSTTGRKLVNLTPDLNQIRTAFARELPFGFTAIGEGLALGDRSVRLDPLARPFALKTIILMTDGQHNTGVSPDLVAARMSGVNVHTVSFGAAANLALMRRISEQTEGLALVANNNAELASAFREIALQLPVLLTE